MAGTEGFQDLRGERGKSIGRVPTAAKFWSPAGASDTELPALRRKSFGPPSTGRLISFAETEGRTCSQTALPRF